MKNLRFLRLHLVSHRELRGRTIEFDPVATVITGENDFGKSSISKSLYGALGASPIVDHPRWRAANVISLLEMDVDGTRYAILREGKTFTLFREGLFIATTDSVTTGLAPLLADIFDFRLRLLDRDKKLVFAPPAYLFLPFYCDQDKGWTDNWVSFARLGQFSHWRQEVIDYHIGATTPAYYDALAQLADEQREREPHARALAGLVELQERTELDRAQGADFALTPEAFAHEVEQLLTKLQTIADERECHRRTVAELSEQRMQLEAQRYILDLVHRELHGDYVFATDLPEESVECPTCGQVHHNSFGERFAIAQDEARTSDVLSGIIDQLAKTEQKLTKSRSMLSSAGAKEQEVRELLNRRRGQVTLAKVIEQAGHRALYSQIEERIGQINQILGEIDRRIDAAKAAVAENRPNERRKRLYELYRSRMADNVGRLNLSGLKEKSFFRIDFSLQETGSDRPRAVLAYMFTMLSLLWESPSSIRCPIVLDSPNQQDLDRENLVGMLEFIRDHRPSGSQLILFAVDDCNIDFGGRRIQLNEEKYFLLSREDYSKTADAIRPYQALRNVMTT